ncbi:MAG: hypothetical protein AB1668_06570, partial [Nanoarchaeota archaeon]
MNEAEKLKKRIKELEEENKRLKQEKEKIKREFEQYKAKCLIQLCWFHILKNSRKHKKNYPDEGTVLHEKLKKIFELAKSY